MRERKFKFWCKGTSENANFNKKGWWSYPNFLLNKYYAHLDIFESPDFIACQYTGLKDKDGKEIYEGDIVEWGMSLDQNKAFPRLRYVEFCERQLIYKVVEVGDLPSSLDYLYEAAPMSTRWCRVVGSIHETPELIEQWVEN
jgi:uncharacterized phage protein (TIGR01671 family)